MHKPSTCKASAIREQPDCLGSKIESSSPFADKYLFCSEPRQLSTDIGVATMFEQKTSSSPEPCSLYQISRGFLEETASKTSRLMRTDGDSRHSFKYIHETHSHKNCLSNSSRPPTSLLSVVPAPMINAFSDPRSLHAFSFSLLTAK